MVGGTGIEAGKAFIKMYLDDRELAGGIKGWQEGLGVSAGKLARFSAAVGAVTGTLSLPFIIGARHLIGYVDTLGDAADRAGMAKREFAELSTVVDLTGGTMQGMERIQRSLGQATLELEHGSKQTAAAFKEMGVDIRAFLAAGTTTEKLGILSDAFGQIDDRGRAAALTLQAVGRETRDLIPLLAMGSSQLQELLHDVRRVTADDKMFAMAAKLEYEWKLFGLSLKIVAAEMATAVAPEMSGLLRQMTELLISTREFVQQHPTLVKSLGALLGVATALTTVAAAGAAFLLFLKAASIAAGMIGGTSLAMGGLAAATVAAGAALLNYTGQMENAAQGARWLTADIVALYSSQGLAGLIRTLAVTSDLLAKLAQISTLGLGGAGLRKWAEDLHSAADAWGDVTREQILAIQREQPGGRTQGGRRPGAMGESLVPEMAAIGIEGAFASQQSLGYAGIRVSTVQASLESIAADSSTQTDLLQQLTQNTRDGQTFGGL
jgi:hypothetical protein